MKGVLVTRPEPGAAETAARLAALGWQPVLAPALVLAARAMAVPSGVQALVLTSRAAARAVPVWPVPVLAVGEATAAEAHARGFTRVIAAAGDAAALAAEVARRCHPGAGPLLLAVGLGYGMELAATLRQAGFRVLRRVAYAAAPAGALPAQAQAALAAGQVGAALFFSPRSAQEALALLAAGLGGAAPGIAALAISPRVAQALAGWPWRSLRVAERPDQDHLVQLLGSPETV